MIKRVRSDSNSFRARQVLKYESFPKYFVLYLIVYCVSNQRRGTWYALTSHVELDDWVGLEQGVTTTLYRHVAHCVKPFRCCLVSLSMEHELIVHLAKTLYSM